MFAKSRYRWHTVILLAILFLASALRFYHLGYKSLWGDEIGLARWSLQPLGVIWKTFLVPDHFFLHFAIVHFVRYIGSSDFWLRLPSAFAGILALPVLYAVGTRLTTRTVAVIAMLLMAVAPFQIWYSQEARMYEPLALYSLLALYFFLRLVDTSDLWSALGLAVSNTVCIYDHIFGAFAILFELVFATGLFAVYLYQRRKLSNTPLLPKWVLLFIASLFLTLVLISPIIPGAMGFVLKHGAKSNGTAPHDFQVNTGFIESLIGSFGLGAGVDWRTLLTAGLALVGFIEMLVQRARIFSVVALWLAIPILAIAVAAPLRDVALRHLIFMQPIYLLAAAEGVVAIWNLVNRFAFVRMPQFRHAVPIIGGAILYIGLVLVLVAPLQAMYSRAKINDWRSIAHYLDAHAEPGDIITSDTNTWGMNALSYYFPNLLRYSTPPGGIDTLQQAAAQKRRLWYVSLGEYFDVTSKNTAQDNLEHVADADWQRTDLEYTAVGEFDFPESESPATIYFSDGKIPSQIIYGGRQGFTNNGAEQVRIDEGETLEAELRLAKDAPRVLHIEFTSKQPADFVVSAEGRELGRFLDKQQIRGQRSAEWQIPVDLPETVLVQIVNHNEEPLFIHSLELK